MTSLSRSSTYRIPIRCSIHMHTFASDGHTSLADICRTAAQEGIDCVILSDHETLGHRVNGYAGGVLVITGEEVTPGYSSRVTETGAIKGASKNNHLLAIGIQEPIANQDRPPQALIDEVNGQGGMSFLAHPQEPGHSWEAMDIEGFTGLEIWTFKAAWKRGAAHWPSKTYAWRNPDAVLDAPTDMELAWWDELGKQRRVVGIGAADNHSFITDVDGMERIVFPLEIGLTAITSYVWTPERDFSTDPLRAVLDGLRAGNVIIAHDGLFPAREFTVQAYDSRLGRTYWPGDCLEWGEGLSIKVRSPQDISIRVLCDGKQVVEAAGKEFSHPISAPGVWRVEGYLKGRPWVFANPFYVGVWQGQDLSI